MTITAFFETIQVVGEGLPIPGQALRQHDLGDVLHPFHEGDHDVALFRLARRKPDAAIADHHRGDAVPGRRIHPAAPDGLAIVVRMDVDETRRHDFSRGIDLPIAPRRHLPDLDDLAVAHMDIADERRATVAIDDGAAANN